MFLIRIIHAEPSGAIADFPYSREELGFSPELFDVVFFTGSLCCADISAMQTALR
jgi:hypothetical protein